MSGKLMSAVYEIDLDHAEAAILGAMADHAKDDGSRCFPSVGRIAWKTNYSERQVQRVIGRLEKMGVLLPIAYTSGGRGFATEYQIVLTAAPAKAPYQRPEQTLDPMLRVATIARFEQICQTCLQSGTYGKGPDDRVWEIVRLDKRVGFKTVNVTLSCGTCLEQKGDILSEEEPETSTPATSPVEDEPDLSQNPDIAVSPQPSINITEPSDEPSGEVSKSPARDFERGYPSWFGPMMELPGYVHRDNGRFIMKIGGMCADSKLDVTPQLLIASFCQFYRIKRLELGWKDPVAALRSTLAREAAKCHRMSKEVGDRLINDVYCDVPVVDEVVPGPCSLCEDHGYYILGAGGKPVLCDHKGKIRDRAFPMLPELDYDEVWAEVLVVLEAQYPRTTFESQFKNTKLIGVDFDQALVKCESSLVCELINRRSYLSLYKALNQTIGGAGGFSELELTMVWGEPVVQEPDGTA